MQQGHLSAAGRHTVRRRVMFHLIQEPMARELTADRRRAAERHRVRRKARRRPKRVSRDARPPALLVAHAPTDDARETA
jgi:hypothetical protein